MIPKTELKNLAAQKQLQYSVQTKLHAYQAFPEDAPDLYLPGFTTQHQLRTVEGKSIPISPLKTTYSGVKQARHDSVSHTASITAATKLGELVNCSFHYLLNGQYVGLDNPQTSELEQYPGLADALNAHLKQSLNGNIEWLKQIRGELDNAFSNYVKPLLIPSGTNLKMKLKPTEFKELFILPAEYVSKVLGAYFSFFENYTKQSLSPIEIFDFKKQE